jgi:hypothetical protein
MNGGWDQCCCSLANYHLTTFTTWNYSRPGARSSERRLYTNSSAVCHLIKTGTTWRTATPPGVPCAARMAREPVPCLMKTCGALQARAPAVVLASGQVLDNEREEFAGRTDQAGGQDDVVLLGGDEPPPVRVSGYLGNPSAFSLATVRAASWSWKQRLCTQWRGLSSWLFSPMMRRILSSSESPVEMAGSASLPDRRRLNGAIEPHAFLH